MNNSITWKYVKPLADSNAVKKYLLENQVHLPADLISIIEKHNGGRPSEKTIVTITKEEHVFKSLLSYNSDDKETIYSIYPYLFQKTPLYPIGSDSAGNFICYDQESKTMVFYNHENGRAEIITKMPFLNL